MGMAEDELETEYWSHYDYMREICAVTREIGTEEDANPTHEEMLEMGYAKDSTGMYIQESENEK